MPNSARILAVEEDALQAAQLKSHMQSEGFTVALTSSGQQALKKLEHEVFDVVLLSAPAQASGLRALAALRECSTVPVILLASRNHEQDRIEGYRQGADDVLGKPFSLVELGVRVQAILRRAAYNLASQALMATEELSFDSARADVHLGNQWAGFTSTEYRVLELLWASAGQTLSKSHIYQEVFHRQYAQHDRSLDMHVSHIRRKLQQIDYRRCRLETVWGKGYQLVRLAGPNV